MAATSARQHHPHEITSNQVDLIDLDTADGLARKTHWSSFVSPETRRLTVEAEFHSLHGKVNENSREHSGPVRSHISWLGIPESGFRGMYRSGGLDLAKSRYQFTPRLTAFQDIPLNMWSSLSMTAEHVSQVADAQAIIQSDLQNRGGQLSGTITNHLDVAIEDWFIAHNNLAYFPKDREGIAADLTWAPGETISLSRLSGVLVLRNYLTGVRHYRVKQEGSKFESDAAMRTSYDPLSRDFDAIFRAISFYEAIGGKEFTTLDNDALEHLDLSPLLGLKRAVLFGRIAGSPTSLLVDGKRVEPSEAATFIRVLIPVQSE